MAILQTNLQVKKYKREINNNYKRKLYLNIRFNMAQSKMMSEGELQVFDNITSLPADLRNAIHKFSESNDYCIKMMAQVQKTMSTIDEKVNTTSGKLQDMSDSLINLFKVKEDEFSVAKIIENVKQHPAGLLANVTSLYRSSDMVDFSTNLISFASLLGFEQPIINGIRDRWTKIEDSVQCNRYQSEASVTKIACLLLAVLGKTKLGFGLTDLASVIKDTKKNASVYKDLIEEIEDFAEEHGFGFSTRARLVKEMKDQIDDLLKKMQEFEQINVVCPIKFCRQTIYTDFKELGQKIEKCVVDMSKKKMDSFIGTSMAATIFTLQQRFCKLKTSVEQVRRTNGYRVVPQGLVLLGAESQIGKSYLMEELENRIKKELHRRYLANPENETLQAFADVDRWETWNQSLRDKYDQNQQGQEGHCIDDCFTNSDHMEHPMLITYISPRAIPTYQADLTSKGLPYNARYVMLSCNTFPRESKTISNPHALANRFPVFVHCSLKPGRTAPPPSEDGTINRDFDWLNLHLSTGNKYYNRTVETGVQTCHTCFGPCECVTIDMIVEQMVTRLIIAQKMYESQEKAYNQNKYQMFYDSVSDLYRGGNVSTMDIDIEQLPGFQRFQIPLDLKNDQKIYNWMMISKTENEKQISDFLDGAGITVRNGDMCTFKWFVEALNVTELSDFVLLYHEFGFKPPTKYESVINDFFKQSFWMDYHEAFLWHEGRIYYNDHYASETPLTQTYEAYAEEHFSMWYYLRRMFTDPLFLVYGLVFVCLVLLGLNGFFAICMVINFMRLHTLIKTGEDPASSSNGDCTAFFKSLVAKAVVAFILWVIYKIVSFLVKKTKMWFTDPIWNKYPEEKKMFAGEFESSKVIFKKRKIYSQINDGTVVFVDQNNTSFGNLSYLSVGKPIVFGTVKSFMYKGVKLIFFACLKNKQIDPAAFSLCLDRVEASEIYLPEKYLSEELKLLVEQHGCCTKYICFEGSYEYSNPYDQHLGRRPKTVTSYKKRDDDSTDDEYEGEGSGKPEQKRTNRSVRKYENEDSGSKQKKRTNRTVRRYEVEDSGAKQRKRENRTVRTYEATKMFAQLTQGIDISASDDSFGEEDYVPSCVEGVDVIDITKTMDFDEGENVQVKFPTASAGTFEGTEALLKDAKYESAVDPNANAILKRIRDELNVQVFSVECEGSALFGIGVGRYIVFPSHLVFGKDEIVLFKRSTGAAVLGKECYLARVVKYCKNWELCGAVILPLKDPAYKKITPENRPTQNLTFPLSALKYVPKDHDIGSRSLTKYCLQYLPKQGFIIPGMISYIKNYEGKLSGINVKCEIFAMQTLPMMNAQTIPGDCGGAVVMLHPSATRKLIGMHIGSASNVVTMKDGCLDSRSTGLIAILSLERLHVLTEKSYASEGDFQSGTGFPKVTWAKPNKYDNFHTLISDSDIGVHLPIDNDDSIKYYGDLEKNQPPCDVKGKTDHHKTPFYGCFEETKKPSALIEAHVPDTSKLLNDSRGNPSILVTQLSGYAGKTYEIPAEIMSTMIEQLKEYMIEVMQGHAIGTSSNSKTAMWEALNGQYFNDDFDKLNEKSSAGIPWTNLGATTKNDFLERKRILNMYRTSGEDKFVEGFYLKDDKLTKYFKRVFNNKIEQAKSLKRTFSIWKACLKDELRKLEKVHYGTTRAFIAPPMESFLMGRFLFGRWKAAFKSNQEKLFHGLGIDMKSLDVTDFISKFKQYKYFMDVDYKNFDQKLLAQFIKAVAVIIVETIRHYEKNDEYANARYVYFEELIYTIICASKTLFMTNRGNKSGNVLTTELNCLVNFLYGWYVFIRTTGDTSLQLYLRYVRDKNFGDDKAMGLTQEAVDIGFNFHAYKKVMAEIGQTVTPGNKSDVELPYFEDICELQFLKRNFYQLYPTIWIAPLDKTSIESVFNYSCLTEEEIEEWQATIREQLMEAMLHGKKYYSTFVKKLREWVSTYKFKHYHPQLREAIMPILLNRYVDMLRSYLLRIGVLSPSDLQKEKIYCESIFENGRTRLRYYTKTDSFESENITESLDKSLMSVMDNVKKYIQQKGEALYNLGLNYGNYSPQETNPETDVQFEGVQSDIGPPVKVMSADGPVYAFDLGQSHGLLPKQIPKIMDVAMSLPDNIKHFQLLDPIYLNGIQPRVVLSPTLKEIAPKADVLMDIFQYHRAKMCLLRIDSRPPLGFSQMIKVAITSTSATDESAFNRQGVTYNLAKCPIMYFLVPFCDRDFMKTRDEKWFKILIEQVTPPILRTDVPEPFRFRPSFEVLELDYYVHKDVQPAVTPIEGIPLTIIPTTALSVSVINNALLAPSTVSTGSTITLQGDVLAIDGAVATSNISNTPFYLLRSGTSGTITIINTGTALQLQFTSAGLPYTLIRDSDYIAAATGSFTGRVNGLQLAATGSPMLGIVGRLPTTIRKRLVTPEKPKEIHVYAADILDHQVDRKFEELYWQNKGKRGFVLPGHKYEGPGNSLNNGVPSNEMDAFARKHDLQYAWASYLYANKRIDKPTFESKIHAADEELATNSNMTSLDGIAANLGMRVKKFVEHFTGLLYPSVGKYQLEDKTDEEIIKQLSCTKPVDYVSILKEQCDETGVDLRYNFKRLVSPDNAPLYECVCLVGDRRFSATEIGKKKAKKMASYIMLLALADGVYQSEDIDPAASEPSAPKNPMPPVAVARPGSLAAGQTVGTIGAKIEVTEQDFVPINTVTVQADAATNDQLFKMRIHPGNFTSGGVESQAQIAYRNHVFSGPGMVNGKISYNTFKITSAANAFQNARIIIAQIPLEYTAAQIDALKATDLKQFPNREHFLHGTETIFNPQWVNRLPVISNHATDASNTNGWLVAKILENSLVDDSTAPRLTYWVCANAVVYSMPRTPTALPVVAT